MRETSNQSSVLITLEIDPETARLLTNLAGMCGTHPLKVAASLLHDIVRDDALSHDESLQTIAHFH